MSLFTGTTSEFKLAGIFGLSSYLLLGPKFKDFIPKENTNKDTPVFMGHGEDDPLVQFEWGQKTAAALKNFGWDVEFKSYAYAMYTCLSWCMMLMKVLHRGLEHSFDPSQETVDLEAFLVKVLPDIKEDSTAPIASKA